MPFANLWFIHLQGWFSILRSGSCPDLYPLIRPPRRSLALGRWRILIPGFIHLPPLLAVYNIFHSLPLGGTGRGFPFTEDETRRHFNPCWNVHVLYNLPSNTIQITCCHLEFAYKLDLSLDTALVLTSDHFHSFSLHSSLFLFLSLVVLTQNCHMAPSLLCVVHIHLLSSDWQRPTWVLKRIS